MNTRQFELTVFSDGGSRGNPGPAAYACIITNFSGETLYQESKAIGVATNNVAEYRGVIAALKWLSENAQRNHNILINLDSLLVVMQLKGEYKVKNETIRNLYFQAKKLEEIIPANITFEHIRREKNQKADGLLNDTLDKL